MTRFLGLLAVTVALTVPIRSRAQEAHEHPAPEVLGKVSFPISCDAKVQDGFDRGVALLHSFAYAPAEQAFRDVAERDPKCAIAHWGIAMSHFHQIWDPPISAAGITAGQREITLAKQIVDASQQTGNTSERERGFIAALGLIYRDAATVPYGRRAHNYELAMAELAAANPKDEESQVFYALALLANMSPLDKTHAKQKQAADILEPLYRANPQHPGMAHYLIHACDNAEMAERGLAAARAYSKIAPSAPHAQHMPSHIFTRLGLWEDSIAANRWARDAAHDQGDIGEELHAMDYLVYAFLQAGRDSEAEQVVADLKRMTDLNLKDFKVGYAATAMPIRLLVERGTWQAVRVAKPPMGSLENMAEYIADPRKETEPPQVAAISVWAYGLGWARTGQPDIARQAANRLKQLEAKLRASGNNYWATQVSIQTREVEAWIAQAKGSLPEAERLLHTAADEEDAIEKLPVTPGPIIPARELLGYLLLEQKRFADAAAEFAKALKDAPGRRGSLQGLEKAKAAQP